MFIFRLASDSRALALNHSAGLSTPQQVQMVFFSLFALMDEADCYKQAMKRVIRRRKKALYRYSPVPPFEDANSVDYYHLLDMELLGKQIYDQAFITWLLDRLKPNEFLFTLADKTGVVFLPSSGFGGASHPSARVSLANLTETQYVQISAAVKEIMDGYFMEYKKGDGKKK